MMEKMGGKVEGIERVRGDSKLLTKSEKMKQNFHIRRSSSLVSKTDDNFVAPSNSRNCKSRSEFAIQKEKECHFSNIFQKLDEGFTFAKPN